MAKIKPKTWVFTLMVWLHGIAIAALGISYLSEYLDPSIFWMPAFFGLAYPFLLIVHLLFIAYFLFGKNWRWILSFLIMGIGYQEFNRTFSMATFWSKDRAVSSTPIKIMTYNVHSFRSTDYSSSPETRNHILEIIRQEKPDIIGFQEFFTKDHGDFDNLGRLQKIMRSYHYYHRVDSGHQESMGMAIFSKFPIDEVELLGFAKSETVNGIISLNVHSPFGKFRLYCVHLQSIIFKPEDYAYLSRIKKEIKPELNPSKRIFSKLKIAFIKRAEQANEVHSSIMNHHLPIVVIGDFNDTPVSYAFKTILGGMQTAFEKKGQGFGKTYNGRFPNFQIDHILCDTSFQVSSFKIIEKKLSDHYPVIASIGFKIKP